MTERNLIGESLAAMDHYEFSGINDFLKREVIRELVELNKQLEHKNTVLVNPKHDDYATQLQHTQAVLNESHALIERLRRKPTVTCGRSCALTREENERLRAAVLYVVDQIEENYTDNELGDHFLLYHLRNQSRDVLNIKPPKKTEKQDDA